MLGLGWSCKPNDVQRVWRYIKLDTLLPNLYNRTKLLHFCLIVVTFEPRCRNNWHIHHKAVQVLICVSGRGWYQEWGKDAVELTPGIVIAILAEVKHWHGAAKDSWFQHLTYHRDAQEGASNEWLEPVTDEVYSKLK